MFIPNGKEIEKSQSMIVVRGLFIGLGLGWAFCIALIEAIRAADRGPELRLPCRHGEQTQTGSGKQRRWVGGGTNSSELNLRPMEGRHSGQRKET